MSITTARVSQVYEQKTYWGKIEEATDKKIIIKWDSVGNIGQVSTTVHGNVNGALVYNNDHWELKL